MLDKYESVELREQEIMNIMNIDDAQHQRYQDHLVANIRPLRKQEENELMKGWEEYDGHDQWQDQQLDIAEMREEEREAREHEAMEL